MRAKLAMVTAYVALVCPSLAWSRTPDAVQTAFVAAAKASDISTMRKLLASPVSTGNDTQLSAAEFLSVIAKCKLTYDAPDMITWRCPPTEAGGRDHLIVGEASSENGKIILKKVLSLAAPPEVPGS